MASVETNSSTRLERILMVCLGSFWLLDGILQLQPPMFTNAFVSEVLAPNLAGQPGFIASIISFGIRLWNIDPILSNLLSALIQLLIGVLLIFPFRDSLHRFGLWLSVVWAFVIWIFGEGFGNLITGTASFYTGAPGSALLYLILALFLLYALKGLPIKKLPMAAGVLFFIGALLNLAPMFWHPTFTGNLLEIILLICLGTWLITKPNHHAAWITIFFLLIVWWFGQSFGGLLTFPTGTTTDPNSAPLFILFLLPIFF